MPARLSSLSLLVGVTLVVAGSAAAQTAVIPQTRSLAPGGAAAANLPNAFDGPAVGPSIAAPLPPVSGAQVTEAQMAEAALRVIIGQLQAGEIDEALFTPDLADRLNGQLATFTPIVKEFGTLQSIEAQGFPNGVGQFLVTFDNAATQWMIGMEEGGLIAALLFRPAPPVSSDPATPPGA